MGDLTYLIILFVVISLVGRIFRAIQKSSGQQAPGTKPIAGVKPPVRPEAKPRDPFAVLADRLEKLAEIEKELPREDELSPYSYIERATEKAAPEITAAETPSDFAHEAAATREAEFESKLRKELHKESFPWQDTQYGYKPPVSPVTPAPGPAADAPRSYRGDVIGMLLGRESVRSAVLLGTILGPCRARERNYRFRGPR